MLFLCHAFYLSVYHIIVIIISHLLILIIIISVKSNKLNVKY